MKTYLSAAMSVLLASSTVAQAHDAGNVAFIGCPEYRPANGGCWTIEHKGVTYSLLNPKSGLTPQLLHKVLVEGEIQPGAPQACGAPMLMNLSTSVLAEVSPECNMVLPPIDGFEPQMPLITEDMLGMLQATLAAPPPPYKTSEFPVIFDFDSAFLAKMQEIPAELAARYAIAAKARQVIIHVGYSQTMLDDGTLLTEDRAILDLRAQLLRSAMIDIGVSKDRVVIAPFPSSPGNGQAARNALVQIIV